jgi:hypothetical protein
VLRDRSRCQFLYLFHQQNCVSTFEGDDSAIEQVRSNEGVFVFHPGDRFEVEVLAGLFKFHKFH